MWDVIRALEDYRAGTVVHFMGDWIDLSKIHI